MGVADGAPWQHILADCQAVLVFASGGSALWDAFTGDCRDHPDHLREEAHPLDAFVERALLKASPAPPASQRWVRCAATETTQVDFRTLGLQAGLGHQSLLGLLLHPVYGPWMGMRLACFTTEPLPLHGPLSLETPCRDCPAPCARACPATAISPQGWNLQRCATFHVESDRCASNCDAREACPVGTKYQYTNLQVHYHYNQQTGRIALAKELGFAPDGPGNAPTWKDWSAQ